jgi:hypothetical protein
MRQSRERLINDLVGDLRPVKRPGKIGLGVGLWLALSTAYSAVVLLATGPMRAGALHDLVVYPAFAGETVLAAAAILATTYAAVRSAIPGKPRPRRYLLWALVPLAAWAAVYVAGLWYPAHPISELGNRDYCIWQAVLFSLPPLALMLWVVRRQFPLWPRTTAMLAGAAAAAIPAEMMQFACKYVPSHILTHHLAPILITAALGAVIGPFALKIRRAVPRRRDVSVH